MVSPASPPTVRLQEATLSLGGRTLWASLDLDIHAGEFLAVLGPNGAGKSSLLRVLLGLQHLSAGRAEVAGRPPRRGDSAIGYVPQQKGFDRDLPLRGYDLVRLGLDGHRWGFNRPSRVRRRQRRRHIDEVIAAVGATSFARRPIGSLSGGEQQRLRVAQAILSRPSVLLCDEPLLSLDLAQQKTVTALLDRQRHDHQTSVVLVTHEINPVLPVVDRVLYLADGRWAAGTAEEVMTSERLSDLYGAQVDVIRVRDRIVVVGAPEAGH